VLPWRRQFDAERLLRGMVFNRLCDPEFKRGILRWLEGSQVRAHALICFLAWCWRKKGRGRHQ